MIKIFAFVLGMLAGVLALTRAFSLPFSSRALPMAGETTFLSQRSPPASATSTQAAISPASSTRLRFIDDATGVVQRMPETPGKKDAFTTHPVLPLPTTFISVPSGEKIPTTSPLVPFPATSTLVSLPKPPPLPSLNLEAIFSAVVKIECPSEDRRGKYVGSGFVLPAGTIVSAAHLLMVSGSETCTVIFPNKNRAPSHWLSGTISEDRAAIRARHDEEGIDVATLVFPPLGEYPEAAAVFPDAYPSIPYPVCAEPDMIGDALMHFGYPSNFLNQSYLSKADGIAIAYADIKGIETLFNQDQTDTYRSPIFSYSIDKQNLHPYMVSRAPSFYGDSGGLAFNATKQCILGPHRGGTIGGGAGENVSIFPLLGWQGARAILLQPLE